MPDSHLQAGDSNLAQRILEIRLPHLRGFNEMRTCVSCNALAVYGRRTHFLSHSATLALMDMEWFGNIDPQTPKINMLVTSLVPLLLVQRWILPIEFTEAANAVINAASQRHPSSVGGDGDDEHPPSTGSLVRRRSVTLLRGSPIDPNGAHVEEENTIVHVILRPATLSKIRFTKFYASPLVKFLLDAVSHGCLLVLYKGFDIILDHFYFYFINL